MNYERGICIGRDMTGDTRFVESVHECVASGFGRPDFDKDDTMNHLQADYVEVARNRERQVVGFLSAKFGKAEDMLPGVDLGEVGEKEVAYLFGTAVRPDVKGNGLYKQLASDFIEEALARGMQTILFSTQNPHVEVGFDSALARLGQKVQKQRIPIPGRYGRLLTGEVPPPVRNGEIQAAYEGLRRDAGDAYAVVYRIESLPGGEGRRNPF